MRRSIKFIFYAAHKETHGISKKAICTIANADQ